MSESAWVLVEYIMMVKERSQDGRTERMRKPTRADWEHAVDVLGHPGI